MEKPEPKVAKSEDHHSFAQPEQAIMTHLDLELEVDFEQKQLKGKAKIHFKNNKYDQLFLDTRGLEIEKITVGDRELKYTLHNEIEYLGSALEIEIDTFTEALNIFYRTSADAPALQWLSPQQTAGKSAPFLFTQSQAILARTWIPCQDSPGIRFTYNAKIKVPKGLTALMSAESLTTDSSDGLFEFKMEQPIPAYLMALAVGKLSFEALGSRTGVYAEPATIHKAKKEFEDLEEMLETAEKIYGEYAWGRYDVLVLPPSFPFGGMENPRITFATPTILAGDKSLVSLVAHELAHSWSGNLVTNATWNDFWLNEGFTVYFEYRIMEEIYGEDVFKMLALISYQDLQSELESMNFSEDTHLKLNLTGRDPDEGLTSIAYDKGFFFLKLIEETVGKKSWDKFLINYFDEHKFKSVNTEEFLAYLDKNLLDTIPGSKDQIIPEKWVYGPGLPDNCPQIVSEKFEKAEQAANNFIENGTAPTNTKGWMYQEWVHFIRSLNGKIDAKQMGQLDALFGLSNSGNNEVLFEWLMLAVDNHYTTAYGQLEKFLKDVGRRKFIAPLYKKMADDENLNKTAERIYKNARPNYHYVATSTIDQYFSNSNQ
ncbi:M1 family metallopeptidase [Flammeovirgaceae bacterium SG7u.111]|nr:M1 family metallopeptidase [Flammeovirgaceae bacterium SG7u.132]WPO34274.1 M1 family metallopeptidase [Flammeovirgaceae bacterium SG7u.111]